MLNLSQRDAKGHKLILGREDIPISASPRLHFSPFPVNQRTSEPFHFQLTTPPLALFTWML